jgi:urease accessory protein UreF
MGTRVEFEVLQIETMNERAQLALHDAAEWFGDWHPLSEQLGSASGLMELSSVTRRLELPPVSDLSSLRNFLHSYRADMLLKLELPAIESAHGHAMRHEVRELVALDQQLVTEPMLSSFSKASRRVGRCQLRKLRPLRDDRVVQRYLNAVESGAALGWHTLVYGLTLALYSLPLRQGLLSYAYQTIRGFIYSAARMLTLSERQCRALYDELCAGLPEAVERLLGLGNHASPKP